MKEHTTIRLESNQKFTFSIKDDWLIVHSHEELERLRIEEKKAKKARFFQTYGRSYTTKQSNLENQITNGSSVYEEESGTEENVLLPNEEIFFDPPAAE